MDQTDRNAQPNGQPGAAQPNHFHEDVEENLQEDDTLDGNDIPHHQNPHSQAEQRRRLLVMIIGLCAVVLLLSDPDPSRKRNGSTNTSTKDPVHRPWETKVNPDKLKNSSISATVAASRKLVGVSFPTNVSGSYQGSWALSTEEHRVRFGSSNISIGVAFGSPLPHWQFPKAIARGKKGSMLLKLSSYPSGLNGVLAVAGNLKLEAENDEGTVHVIPFLRGLYVIPTGEIALAYSPSAFRMVLLGPDKNDSDINPPKASKKNGRLMEKLFSGMRELHSNNLEHSIDTFSLLSQSSQCAVVVRGILGPQISHSSWKSYRKDFKNITNHTDFINVEQAKNLSSSSFHSFNGDRGIGPGIRQMRGQIFSPNCGFSNKRPSGGSSEGKVKLGDSSVMNFTASATIIDHMAVESKATTYALLEMGSTLTQMVLQLQQLIICASAQASAMRMSLFSLGMNGVLDAYITLIFLLVGIIRESLFSAFLTLAFLKLLQFSVLELRLMMMIWKARHPDGFSQGAAALRRTLGQLYLRFYAGLLAAILLSYIFYNHLQLLIFLGSSYWVPQIIHNIEQGQADGYTMRYILAMTVTRLFTPLYFLGCSYNFLRAYIPTAGNYFAFSISLVTWSVFQVGVMVLQRKFGARFFIPKVLLPQEYDYHRPITVREGRVVPTDAYPSVPLNPSSSEEEETNAEGMGRVRRLMYTLTGPCRRRYTSLKRYCRRVYSQIKEKRTSSSRGYRRVSDEGNGENAVVVDSSDVEEGETGELQCLICMCELERPLRRRDYMVTPCNHLFHTECLQRWLEVKLECPTCRHSIPPIAN